MDRRSEVAHPDYYSVVLPGEGITAEMTGRSRSGIFRFTYSRPGKVKSFVSTDSTIRAVLGRGAENETRTRDPNLGKVVLYQLSYFRRQGHVLSSGCKYTD